MSDAQPVSALLLLTPTIAAHMTLALAEHARWCRRNGSVMPPELAALLEALTASEGQQRPQLGDDSDAVEARLVSYKNAARLLALSERTVRRQVAAGRLPVVRVGRRALIPVAELARLANAKGTAA